MRTWEPAEGGSPAAQGYLGLHDHRGGSQSSWGSRSPWVGGPCGVQARGRVGPFSPLRLGRRVSGVRERGVERVAAPACRFPPPMACRSLRPAGRDRRAGVLTPSPAEACGSPHAAPFPTAFRGFGLSGARGHSCSVTQQGLTAPAVPVLRLLPPPLRVAAGLPLSPKPCILQNVAEPESHSAQLLRWVAPLGDVRRRPPTSPRGLMARSFPAPRSGLLSAGAAVLSRSFPFSRGAAWSLLRPAVAGEAAVTRSSEFPAPRAGAVGSGRQTAWRRRVWFAGSRQTASRSGCARRTPPAMGAGSPLPCVRRLVSIRSFLMTREVGRPLPCSLAPSHLLASLAEMSRYFFSPFFNWAVYFSLLSFKSSSCVLDSSPVSGVSLAKVSQCVAGRFLLSRPSLGDPCGNSPPRPVACVLLRPPAPVHT